MGQPVKKEDVSRAVAAIAMCIAALEEREKQLGPTKAFDPNDPETGTFFQALWHVSFDQYANDPKMQDEIIRELALKQPKALATMRRISNVSEIEMEKGYARRALVAAATMPDGAPFNSLAARVHKWRYLMANEDSKEGKDAARSTLGRLIGEQSRAVDAMTRDFPYHTYQALTHGEELMLTSLQGLDTNQQIRGMHLVVEAGALPFTAIFSSISRVGGEVIATIGDKESFDLATKFVHELERTGIVEENKIHLLNVAPEALKTATFADSSGKPVTPYSATITQLVQPVVRTEAVIQDLKQKGIDTFIGRGANGMTRLLYGSLDGIKLPQGVGPRFVSIPRFSEQTERQRKSEAQVVSQQYMCYNTSHVFSAKPINRQAELPESMTHFFETVGAGHAK